MRFNFQRSHAEGNKYDWWKAEEEEAGKADASAWGFFPATFTPSRLQSPSMFDRWLKRRSLPKAVSNVVSKAASMVQRVGIRSRKTTQKSYGQTGGQKGGFFPLLALIPAAIAAAKVAAVAAAGGAISAGVGYGVKKGLESTE